MKKVGLVLSFYDFRNDVRELIRCMSTYVEVVVFYNEFNRKGILEHSFSSIEYREIDEKVNGGFNPVVNFFYNLFKKIPRSRVNYLLMEEFKWGGIKNMPFSVKLSYFFKKIGLNYIDYDDYLNCLSFSSRSRIDDIDNFILFTNIPSDLFLARLIRENKRIYGYVYSWDHPCKHTSFSKRIEYLVWSESLRIDLSELQSVPDRNIRVVGASQFTYLYDFLENEANKNEYDFDYIYFCCSVGAQSLVLSELEIIISIAKWLSDNHPNLYLVVRLYPVLFDWSVYATLDNYKNIVIENDFRTNDLSMSREDIERKLSRIKFSKLVLHTGSTIGLESLLLGKAAYLIYFPELRAKIIWNFINQYQNKKYYVNNGHILTSFGNLSLILNGDVSTKKRNDYFERNDYFVKSLKELTEDIVFNL